jgi:hypothetical protein
MTFALVSFRCFFLYRGITFNHLDALEKRQRKAGLEKIEGNVAGQIRPDIFYV